MHSTTLAFDFCLERTCTIHAHASAAVMSNLRLPACGSSPEEADAQSLRVAVLLDELDFPGFGKPDPRTGHIIVELKQV